MSGLPEYMYFVVDGVEYRQKVTGHDPHWGFPVTSGPWEVVTVTDGSSPNLGLAVLWAGAIAAGLLLVGIVIGSGLLVAASIAVSLGLAMVMCVFVGVSAHRLEQQDNER